MLKNYILYPNRYYTNDIKVCFTNGRPRIDLLPCRFYISSVHYLLEIVFVYRKT